MNLHPKPKPTSPEGAKKRLPRFCIALYLLALISLPLYFVFVASETFADWFNQSIAAVLRRLLASLTTWLPFSVAELLLCLVPLAVVLLIVIAYRHFCASRHDAAVFIGILLSAPCLILTLFVWSFAPGYYGTKLDQKLELDRREVSAQELSQTAKLLSDQLKDLTPQIVFLEDGSSLMPYSYEEMNQKLLKAYDSFCQEHDFVKSYYSLAKPVALSEPMSYTHITGVYTFFTGEANINVHFPDYTVPYTAAHELAHQRGIAREDEANFIAFLVCMESEDPYIRYSAILNLYEYVASALYKADRDLYYQSYLALPADVRAEEVAYSRFFDRFRDNVAADISEATNNSYLQSQGESQGTRSYGMVVDLAVAYYKSNFD